MTRWTDEQIGEASICLRLAHESALVLSRAGEWLDDIERDFHSERVAEGIADAARLLGIADHTDPGPERSTQASSAPNGHGAQPLRSGAASLSVLEKARAI